MLPWQNPSHLNLYNSLNSIHLDVKQNILHSVLIVAYLGVTKVLIELEKLLYGIEY